MKGLSSDGKKYKVTILRDTRSSQSLLLRKALPNIDANITNDNVLMRDRLQISAVPLADIYLDCPIKTGNVVVGIRDVEFPVTGVILLLGNVIVTEKPVTETFEPDSDGFVNPCCVVTHSQRSSLDEECVTPIDCEA